MKLSSQSYSTIEQTLESALLPFRTSEEVSKVTDLYIQPKQGIGELLVYNDDEEELARTVIEEWTGDQDESDENFYKEVEPLLHGILTKLQSEGKLENLSLMKPYSFVLVDDEKETVSELLLVDDDTLMLSNELLEGLDEELDDFLKKLLE